ncbi:MAG: hypothetical protein Q8L41_08575 [Anaerolineales bacterium]|nr:hypothetical protein [Anaerolineales bacterium]
MNALLATKPEVRGMRYFVKVQTVVIDAGLVVKAKSFAKQVTPTIGSPGGGYRDTNQFNLQKIEKDHFVSKIGEEAVRIVFEQLGRRVQGPDYQIYKEKQKSWDSDLYIDGRGLAVKTQAASLAKKFGLSWTFQAGIYRKDPILNNLDAWVCFVEFNETTRQCGVYPPYQIKELTFGEPKLDRLKGGKKVVYAESLPAR